jgi:biotin carboxylase
MRHVLLLATTTGYQVRAFGEAAERLDVKVTFATDRCHLLDDPWRDGAIPIRFHEEDPSVDAIVQGAATRPLDGILAVGDRPTVIAARVAERLGLAGHPVHGARAARDKQTTRERLRAAGLPVPWFEPLSIASTPPDQLASRVHYPCVIKPVSLSGSRGVMRADSADELVAAWHRLAALMRQPDVRAERDPAHDRVLVEGFIPGRELAIEGLLDDGRLQVLALFDKPDPLDGPFFEETIYVAPAGLSVPEERLVIETVGRAAAAIGLRHGPIHAECRVNERGVFVLEVAARPIGGLCARALRFVRQDGTTGSLEELLLRHALGEPAAGWSRESRASAVMMIPIPAPGVYRGVSGLDAASVVDGVDEVTITAKPDQVLVPLPEGASYLGFIFAHGESNGLAVAALRQAHRALQFAVEPQLRVVQSPHGAM